MRRTSKSKFADSVDDVAVGEQFKLTFDSVYRAFVSMERVDVFERLMRSEFRTKSSKLPTEQAKAKLIQLKQRPKTIPPTLNNPIEDPFQLLSFDVKTPVQEMVVKHSNWMPYYGNYAYCCSCGAGKTLAGIYLLYKFQCKSLIISSKNAVNDQWFSLIFNLYPQLIIKTKDGWFSDNHKLTAREKRSLKEHNISPDIFVFSPQYLAKKVDKYKLKANLIIYDEVHSLLSDEFIKVLLLPLYKVINNEIPELPLMLALSATYPSESTVEGKASIDRLNKLFGSVFKMNSDITRIPVHVWDYRDHYTKLDKKTGEMLTGEEALGTFDSKYIPLDDYQAIEYFCDKIAMNNDRTKIEITSRYKGLVMTYRIDSSVYAALLVHRVFNCNIVLMRSADDCCYLLEKDVNLDYEFDDEITLKKFEQDKVAQKIPDYRIVVDRCEIIVGTLQRLKEGFSVQNITWGICTKFVYSTISRIQLLGRIRRNSKDEELNNHYRIFYVVSGTIPNTIGIPNYKGKHKITYNLSNENTLFRIENYIRI